MTLGKSLHSSERVSSPPNVGRDPSTMSLPLVCQHQQVVLIVLGQGHPESWELGCSGGGDLGWPKGG